MTASCIETARAAFRQLHASGCFILPNPWNAGSAKWLASLGFKALASTSSGFAFSQGKPDGSVPLEQMLTHLQTLVDATPLPVNADFENGHAQTLVQLDANVRLCVATGVAGLSIEDFTGDRRRPLYELKEAVARLEVARAAIDASDASVLLVGRAEGFFHGQPDLAEIIRRLTAYAEAGADCLYAPGLSTRAQIAAVVQAVAPKPVNVLMGPAAQIPLAELASLGVRRISTGGALALSAWSGFARAAAGLAAGRFDDFEYRVSHAELGQLFSPLGQPLDN